jgi:hypothetical protein
MTEPFENSEQPLANCMAARAEGADFPTIWTDILCRHPLVLSLPVQVTLATRPALEVGLANGQLLCFQEVLFFLV